MIDSVCAVQPEQLTDQFTRILSAPLAIYTTGAADQHIGLEEMERVFAPYRSDSPTAGQPIIPVAPTRPHQKGPVAKAAGPNVT